MTMNREMMKRIAWAAGAVLWAVLVFEVALRLTFPSEAMSRWLVYQVSQRMSGYHAELGSVRPWWTGVAVHDAKLFTVPLSRAPGVDEAETPTLVALADRVRGRLSPWALLSGGYDVRGDVRLIDGTAAYRVGVRPDERGRMLLTDLMVRSDGMPLAELLPLLPMSEVPSGSGVLDVDVDVQAGEDGLKQATGRIAISGTNLVISDLATEMTGPIGMEIPIQELRIDAPIKDGKASITQGIATGELATIELEGDLVLRDPLSRSTLELRLLISNLGPALQPMAGFLGTPHADGKYHYQIRGLAMKPSVSAVRESMTSSSSGRVSSGASPVDRTSAGYVSPSTTTESPEERERRIADAQERLRQRREQRDATTGDILSTRGRPPVEEESEDIPDEEEEEEPSFEADDEPGGPVDIALPEGPDDGPSLEHELDELAPD